MCIQNDEISVRRGRGGGGGGVRQGTNQPRLLSQHSVKDPKRR